MVSEARNFFDPYCCKVLLLYRPAPEKEDIMVPTKVEVFEFVGHSVELQSKLNSWLAERPGIDIVSVACPADSKFVMVFYRETSGN